MFKNKFYQADDGLGGGFEGEPVDSTDSVENIPDDSEISGNNEEAAEPQQESNGQSADLNAQFANVRREAATRAAERARDEIIDQLLGQSHGIHTHAEYQAAMQAEQARQEAEQIGVDPRFYQEFSQMKSQLQAIEHEKAIQQQEQQLSSDPDRGSLFNQWKDDIKATANQFGVDLQTAFTFLLDQRIGSIVKQQQVDTAQLKQQAVQEYLESLKNGNAPVEGSGSAPVIDRTPKNFEDARKGALAMLRAARNR